MAGVLPFSDDELDEFDDPHDEAGGVSATPEAVGIALSEALRAGDLPRAVSIVATVAGDPPADAEVSRVLDASEVDGLRVEVALLETARRRPEVLTTADAANGIGAAAGIVTFLVLVWPFTLFAFLPAMAARLLASELTVQLHFRQRFGGLEVPEAHRARILLDLEIYRTGDTPRLERAAPFAMVVAGVGLYLGALWVVDTDGLSWIAWQLAVAGTMFAFGGGVSISGVRRLHRAGLVPVDQIPSISSAQLRQLGTRGAADRRSGDFCCLRPRLGRSMLPAVVLGLVGAGTAQLGGPWLVVAAVSWIGAASLAFRAWGTLVEGFEGGIVDRGLLRTRRWGWEEIAAVRLEASRGLQPSLHLHMITVEGSDHRLVPDAGRGGGSPALLQLVDELDALALGSHGGPTRRTILRRALLVAFLLACVSVFAALTAVLGLGGSTESVPTASVPAGRETWEQPDRTHVTVTCPPLTSWSEGRADPLCGDRLVAVAIGTTLLAIMTFALTVVFAKFARSWGTLLGAYRQAGRARAQG